MSRCDKKQGLFGYCTKEKLHPGDHDNGKKTWPRVGTELRIYERTLLELERLRAERQQLDALVERHQQTDSGATSPAECQHMYKNSLQFGDIKQKDGEDRPYREFWSVRTCTRCGATEREQDEYYGEDMAMIHITWPRTGY
jgi:hypothetical protein